MAWFGALVDGTASSVGWLISNAGDISTAYNAVKNVLGGTSTDFIGDGIGNIVPTLWEALEDNKAAMATTVQNLMAGSGFKNFTKDFEPSGQILQDTFDFAGILPFTALLAKGQAPQEIVADLNKLLTLHGFPTVLDGIDIAQQIGAQMFSTRDQVTPNFLPPTAQNAIFYKSPAINISTGSDSTLVQAQHVFYQVPINGTTVDADTLHSYTRINTFLPVSAQSKLAAQKRALALRIVRRQNQDNIPQPYNSTTVSATWTTTGNDSIMSQLVKKMNGTTYRLTSESSDGQKYSYQFRTDVKIGPGAVLQAFDAVIAAAITTGNMPDTDIVSQRTCLG
jgi:hypothetical protein